MDLWSRRAVSAILIRIGLWSLYAVSGTDQSSVEEVAAGHRGRDNTTP